MHILSSSSIFFLYLFHIFIYLFVCLFVLIFVCIGSSLLHAAFSSCGEWGLLFIVVHRLLIAMASLVVEHGL